MVLLPRFAAATRWDEFVQAWYGNRPAPEPPGTPKHVNIFGFFYDIDTGELVALDV